MKQKIKSLDQNLEFVAQNKTADNNELHSTEEMDALYRYWLAYSYPFVPMIDLTIIYDEIRKMVKHWLVKKREHKNKIHENI
ncbi:hypothetical protein RYH73_01415 [Olivibacter sp. CPCC 100613]|uniref:hypothetical protein n=1 Tax=Olivibacter sp. CPCC 100613 TaxID=3079931 RepID=UPI002FF8D5DE